MNWTYIDDYNILPNLIVRSKFLDGILKWYELYPCEGYVLHVPSGDDYQRDEDGNLILDTNGNPINVMPYYSQGGATVMPTYDFTTNLENYHADLY
jgi:hypothetical protein